MYNRQGKCRDDLTVSLDPIMFWRWSSENIVANAMKETADYLQIRGSGKASDLVQVKCERRRPGLDILSCSVS